MLKLKCHVGKPKQVEFGVDIARGRSSVSANHEPLEDFSLSL